MSRSTLLQHSHDAEHQLHAAADCGAFIDSTEICADGRHGQPHVIGNLLIAHVLEDRSDNLFVLRRELHLTNNLPPGELIQRERHGLFWSTLASEHCWVPEIKGVEPRTLGEPPARGAENVPWPTPLLGARLQGTASPKLAGFTPKQ